MKALLVHVAHRRGAGDEAHFELMALPQGMFALGALLQDEGHEVELVHLGLERALEPGFDLEQQVRAQAPELVGISLHWHHGALDVREAVEAARRGGARFVLLGGITASLMHRQIMGSWPELDGVIRGDAEVPLQELVRALEGAPGELEQRLASVPNLTWRRGGDVVANPLSYAATPGDLARLCFSRLELLRHHPWYSGLMTFDPASESLTAQLLMRRFYLPVSRGCARGCPRCGGARQTTGPATGREGATFCGVGALVRTMGEVLDRGISAFYISCHPADHEPGYYPRLFQAVEAAGLSCSLEVEAFAYLPDEAFLAAFARVFDARRSRVILSPQGSEARRRRHGARYTDEDLRQVMRRAAALGVAVRSHLGVGPGDSREDLVQALEMAVELSAGAGRGAVIPLKDEVDPCAPWTRQASALGVHRPNLELGQIIEGSRLRREAPRGHPDPGYRLRGGRAAWLALRAACHPGVYLPDTLAGAELLRAAEQEVDGEEGG